MHPSRRYQILVVDDDASLQETLKLLLEMEDFEVQCVADGAQALAALETAPMPDLILLDLMMPVMNGFQFLDHLSSCAPPVCSIPVIVFSAGDRLLLEDPRLRNVVGVVAKPFEADGLVQVIRSGLVGGTAAGLPPALQRESDGKYGAVAG